MATRVVRLVCYLLYRVLLPAVLLVSAAVRFNALSFIYTIFLLLNPLLSSPTPSTIRGGTGIYLRIVFVFGLLGVLAHSVFHITLSAIATDTKPYGSMFPNCSANERLARQIAVERLDGVPAVDVIRLVLPDIVVFIAGLIVYLVCYKLLPVETSQIEELPSTVKKQTRSRFTDFFIFIGEFTLLMFLAASGIIVPGVLSAVYFLTFIFLATLWAFYGHLGVKFSVFRVLLLIYSAAHILLLHLYQFQFFQDAVSPDDFIPRLLGLTAVVVTDCASPHKIFFKDSSQWPWFVNPVFLLLLYYTLAFEVRRNFRRSVMEPEPVHLVDSEVRDYSTIEQPEPTGSGSTTMLASDTEKEDEDQTDGPDKGGSLKRRPVVSLLVYIMRQSYVLSLIAMMAWSITFHSWLTFVLLLAACFIWMMPNSRRVCYIVSPIILLYGICLLIIQFVYGMNLKDTELPTEKSGIKLADIGLKKFPYPCLQLALQVLYTLMFWLTLRQYMRERRQAILAEGEKYPLEPVNSTPPTTPQSLPEMLHGIGQYVWYILCKYWIFVCSGMLLVISLQEVVVYRIIYMILFLAFVLVFQYFYAFWRLTMFLFWWVVIVYSMLVLIVLYTYQFDNVAQFWMNSTQLSSDTLADIGLEKFDTAGLFIRLLTPTSFLIFIIIQVHYFHKPFMLLSDLDRFKTADNNAPRSPAVKPSVSVTSEIEEGQEGQEKKKKSLGKRMTRNIRKFWFWASETWETVTRFFWRLAEIHVSKLVAFTIIMVCVYEVSAISAVYVILLVIFLPMTGCPSVLSHLVQFWTALVLLAKMIYQLGLVDNSRWLSNCTTNGSSVPVNTSNNASSMPISIYMYDDAPFNSTIDNAIWAGLNKTNNIGYYLRNYIGILLVLIFERIVIYHQTQYFNTPDVIKPKTGIIFPEITRPKADEGMVSCLKYFLNYFFYKFGLELCYIMSAIAICVRVDVVSVIYALLLGLILLLSRRGNTIFWPIYTIILVVLLPVQFLLVLGLPVGVCYRYVWDEHTFFNRQLEKWLYLPDYIHPPNSMKLVADFFQLLFVCLQWRVFRVERACGADVPDGGSNEEIIPEVEAKVVNPVEDFTTKITSYLDIIKNFVFTYMYWVTLAIVFIAGTARINLFSMGYVIAVFCFMWFGQEFLIKPLRQLLRAWNFLIGYCFFVLFFKAALQLPGCVYIETIVDNACWLVQLLGLTCLKPAYNYPDTSDICTVEKDNTGLSWDVVCFTFLLLQRRIYASHYFRHVVADFEAQNRLASRGCQLINKVLRREVEKQRQEEITILTNIKKKMNALKQKQSKYKGSYVEPEEHFQAIRSGDYYLFEDSSEDEQEPEEVDTITFGTDEKEGDKGPTPLQLINTAVTQGTEDAVKQADEAASSSKPSSPTQVTSPSDETDAAKTEDKTEEEEEEKGGVVGKITNIFKFILALLGSCIDWCINLFNRISKNYRLVAAKLKDDHIRMKQQIQAEHVAEIKEKEVELEERGTDDPEDQAQDGAPSESTDLVEVTVEPATTSGDTPAKSEISLSVTEVDKFDEETEFEENQPRLYRLLVATYFALISRTELLCYFLMILNHIMNASLLSLPLPMFVFLWGMLSVPRPTKTFWITVITYTEAVVVVKYLFQFGFFPWNDKAQPDDPYYPPKIIGIEKKDRFAALDLVLLLALFIHRIFLKRYGLWKDAEEEEEIKDDSGRPSIQYGKGEEFDQIKSEERRTSSLMVEASVKDDTTSLEDSLPSDGKKKETSKLKTVFMPFYNFYKQLTSPDYSATTDVYAPMFACDFINFLIILLAYQSFGPAQTAGDGDVTSYISDNRIPVPFLIMLLGQFVLIIIDRALYLRKNVLGKFIYQIILVILLHVLLFFVLPSVTNKPFTQNKPAQLWYFIKCVYFALSAYQIKSAYPTRILGNFLTKKYNYVNLFLFKGFLAIPFLLELRTLMDWMWTNTTMAVGSWLQMEDIYANIYVLKCFRVIEKNHPTPRAVPKKALIKYGVGGVLLFVIIFIIWFPLVIFSFANTVYVANPPLECTISVSLAGYQPLFSISGQQQNIRLYTEGQFSNLKVKFEKQGVATSFLSNYDAHDVTKIQLDGKSTSLWGISPPSELQLINDLNNDNVSVRMEFLVSFKRKPNSEAGELLSQMFTKTLSSKEKRAAAVLISTNTSTAPVTISNVFPEYMRLGGKTADPVTALLSKGTTGYSNINITLQRQADVAWWEILDLNGDNNLLTLTTFNDRVAPAGLSVITGYGIIGLYISLVLVIGRFVRVFFTGGSTRIMFEELPNVDNVLNLCLNLYMARECGEYYVEEYLFSKLLFVYRSSEMMIRFTKYKIE